MYEEGPPPPYVSHVSPEQQKTGSDKHAKVAKRMPNFKYTGQKAVVQSDCKI